MPEWTTEVKTELVEAYKKAEPTPQNSMDIVKELAEDFEATPNGVRGILSKAGVYIKKEPAKAASTGEKSKTTRVSKVDAQAKLTALIESLGKEADEDVISKLTGKAALYLVSIFSQDETE